MSVIVRDEEGKLLLFSKGADRFVNPVDTFLRRSSHLVYG